MDDRSTRIRICGDDTGAVAVIVALLLVVFILFAALVVDLGYWYNVRRQLQAAADGAALAGCWEVIKSGDKVAALSTARTYAGHNAVAPADGLEMIEPGSVNPSTGHPYTEVTDTYVKVTVRKHAPAFFSVIMGYSGEWIMAQSRADAQWLSGMKGLVPWSVPIIAAPTRVTVRVGGGPEQTMTKGGDELWHGYGITVGQNPASSGYPLTVTVYNSRNVPTELAGVAGVVVREPTAPFTNVRLDRYVVQSGDADGIDAYITCAEQPTSATFNGHKFNKPDFVSVAAGEWRLHLASPVTDQIAASFPLDLEFGQGNSKYQLTSAAYVVARRSTYPMRDVFAEPHTVAGPASTIDVDLELNDYEYGHRYELKVTAGAEVGNFCAVDLAEIFHPPNFGNPQPAEYDLQSDLGYHPPAYIHYLENEFPFEIHLGDILWTDPGNLSGPQTDNALQARFAGDTQTWASWNGATPPRPPTKRLVYVPVVEKADTTSGHSPLVVVGITSFFIEPASSYTETITGYFVEYVAGGQGQPNPPSSGWGIQTPRLVSTEIDF
jgi:hypothetical protein